MGKGEGVHTKHELIRLSSHFLFLDTQAEERLALAESARLRAEEASQIEEAAQQQEQSQRRRRQSLAAADDALAAVLVAAQVGRSVRLDGEFCIELDICTCLVLPVAITC
jgi:hypothetical protein